MELYSGTLGVGGIVIFLASPERTHRLEPMEIGE